MGGSCRRTHRRAAAEREELFLLGQFSTRPYRLTPEVWIATGYPSPGRRAVRPWTLGMGPKPIPVTQLLSPSHCNVHPKNGYLLCMKAKNMPDSWVYSVFRSLGVFFFFLLGLNIPNAFREIFHLSRLLALHLTGLLACNEDSGVEWIKLTYILRKHTVC